ncbi:MAG: T9SS type A sorting domain-containing protein [Saprospiraceae bacterium]|nr:T9SS type A sorting domain-containing protein [Candidatus Vicinibacter affinis]
MENDQINLVEIPAGLYYLVVRDQQGSKIFRKFIKI